MASYFAWAVPVAVSFISLAATIISSHYAAKRKYVDSLVARVDKLEDDLRECIERCRRLRDENIDLMRKLCLPESEDKC